MVTKLLGSLGSNICLVLFIFLSKKSIMEPINISKFVATFFLFRKKKENGHRIVMTHVLGM